MPFATLEDVTLHYRLTGMPGRRSSVVLINSLGTDLRIWDTVCAALSGIATVLTYDFRGHGLSELGAKTVSIDQHASDLIALLDHLDFRTATVCGLSVGGQIAMALHRRQSERVASLVLANTAPRIGTPEIWSDRMAAITAGGLQGIADAVMQRWFSPDFFTRAPAELRGYRTMLLRQPLDGYLATCAAIRDFDATAQLAQICTPVLCIGGSDDGATPPALVREMAGSLPVSRYHEIRNVGHLPAIEAPAMLATLIGESIALSRMEMTIGR